MISIRTARFRLAGSKDAGSWRASSRSQPRRRWIWAAIALGTLTCVWLVMTASTSEDGTSRFFGLWRTRHVLVGCLAAWLTLAAASALVSRKMLASMLLGTMLAVATWLLLEVAGFVGLVDYPVALGLKWRVDDLGTNPAPNVYITGVTYQDTARRLGLKTEPIPFRYQTNRQGYRNRADRTAADIYLLGDSMLVAALLPFDKTVTSLLEHELGCTTMNIALIGISPQQERDIFLDARLPLENRLVLHFIFEGNDLLDSGRYRKRGEGQPKRKSPLVHRTLAYNFARAVQDWTDPKRKQGLVRRHIGYIDGDPYTFRWTADSFEGLEDEVPHVLAALSDVRKAVLEAGGSYAVVVIPSKLRVLAPLSTWLQGSVLAKYDAHLGDLPDQLRQWCDEEGIEMLDLTGALICSAEGGHIPWFSGDTHWNAKGREIAA